MYKIAMVCENGASTGLCMRKMIEYAKQKNIECDISAHPQAQVENILDQKDCFLFGPQIAFKLDGFKKKFPDHADKFTVINSMDFGMMDGAKILTAAITLVENNRKGKE